MKPKYFKVTKLEASDLSDPSKNEDAYERAGLLLVPPSAVVEYAHGWHDGHADFKKFMATVDQGAKKAESDERPH